MHHFIGKDSVEIVVVERHHPSQTFQLILLKMTPFQQARLHNLLIQAMRAFEVALGYAIARRT